MRYILLSFLILGHIYAFGQETATKALSDFSKITVIGNFSTEIIPSDKKEVTVEVFEENVDLDKLKLTYSGDRLTIKYEGSFVKDIGINLIIEYPNEITEIDARRGAEIEMKNVGEIKEIEFKADSGSKIIAENIKSELVNARLTKGGSIQLRGETKVLEPFIRAGGTIASVNLRSTTVNATVTFGGEIICAPEETLNATVTSGGTINYTGNPTVNQTIKLGGTIAKI